ncbi:hypothetical protein [Kribbella sp. NPDC006257]|uniref:hypothetical protein n=1 Tax=Kribbella sp. NPDC006257 TaxID=3156738 RepID=UPI0033B591AA
MTDCDQDGIRRRTGGVLVKLVAGLCCLLVVAGCESTADRLEINIQSLQSDATDGAVLAGEIIAGRTDANFARTHAQELQDDTTQIEKNVYDQRLPEYDKLQQLADDIGTALGTIAVRPDDRSVAEQAQTTLRKLADDAAGMMP